MSSIENGFCDWVQSHSCSVSLLLCLFQWEERVVIKTQDEWERGILPLCKSYHPHIRHHRFCECKEHQYYLEMFVQQQNQTCKPIKGFNRLLLEDKQGDTIQTSQKRPEGRAQRSLENTVEKKLNNSIKQMILLLKYILLMI